MCLPRVYRPRQSSAQPTSPPRQRRTNWPGKLRKKSDSAKSANGSAVFSRNTPTILLSAACGRQPRSSESLSHGFAGSMPFTGFPYGRCRSTDVCGDSSVRTASITKSAGALGTSRDWQLPAAAEKPLRWTEGQIARFLHVAHATAAAVPSAERTCVCWPQMSSKCASL